MTSLSACVAEIMGVEPAELPDDEEGVRGWLAAHGLGLVPVAEPREFAWPGRFLGRDDDGSWAVLFGVPPGVIAGSMRQPPPHAFVIAGHDPRAFAPPEAQPGVGTVEAIVVAPAAEAPAELVEAATADAGRGLRGDRYHESVGTFSGGPGGGRDLTLVEAEALEDVELPFAQARRNVVVRGLELDSLLGRRFVVGEVECVGRRRCEPCAHLQRLTRPGILRALVHRGGLRADVVQGGEIRLGDVVRPVD
jgi:MOSC domain-containing protein YiiM